MRKLMLLFLCVIFYTTAYSQVIKGTILDGHTKNPIMSASIYFNGTFVGTSSDQNGKFELDISNNTSLPLTISSIGYNSVTLKEYAGSERFVISLTPRVYELGEVIIENKKFKKKRRANLKLFKNEFLGTTFNALDCKIINENDITFTYSSDKDTIKAFTSKPIIIHNRSLGYKVTYFLMGILFSMKIYQMTNLKKIYLKEGGNKLTLDPECTFSEPYGQMTCYFLDLQSAAQHIIISSITIL
jgi:hypothetical protein